MRNPQVAFVQSVRKSSVCSVCGGADTIQFHHIRRKRFTLGNRIVVQSIPMHILIQELKRCVPLCNRCHMLVHEGTLVFNHEQALRKQQKRVDRLKERLG